MAGFPDMCENNFPLQGSKGVLNMFKQQLTDSREPDLTLLSLVIGKVENTLTVNRSISHQHGPSTQGLEPIFPIVELSVVKTLYIKFYSVIRGSVDLTEYPGPFASRGLVKRVSDVVWGSLSKSYHTDKAHLQTLYSLLTGNKLDCMGLAYAVVAGCQILGYSDVHLALSEDHAWVVFGENGSENAEITWHGKGNEDKRGQPITTSVADKNWLYLNSQPVVCNRSMEVAALVSGINPAINSTTDSVEMGSLQQELLWMLYDMGHLKSYPMAVSNLGDLEEISPTPGRPTSLDLLTESIQISRALYCNQHIYPYTYLGAHLYRKGRPKAAIQSWAEASSVIRCYNYNRDDEEIYKEFLEISNDLIPKITKKESESHSPGSLLTDGEAYGFLLRFYDGICQWEEGSSTPVLHVGWAKQFCTSLARFDPSVRERCQVCADGEQSDSEQEKDEENDNKKRAVRKQNGRHSNPTIEELSSRVGGENPGGSTGANPNIAALAQACSESILNPDYLLGSGEPFSNTSAAPNTSLDTKVEVNEFLSSKSHSSPFPGMTIHSMLKAESPADMAYVKSQLRNVTQVSAATPVTRDSDRIVLYSEKMKGLKSLLTARKLNANAIQLHLTAQSQVTIRPKKHGIESTEYTAIRKRTRRE